MATSVTFNGSTYSVPANREPRGWGTSLSAFLVDVGNNALSKAGGNFTLTADANFGATYGLVLKYIKSASSNIAQSGVIRFANNEGLAWRNAANNADLTMKINASNNLEPGAPVELTVASLGSAPTYAAGRMWYDTADNTMRYFNDSTGDSVNIGQEINVKVRNTSGSTITAGQVLRCTGAAGSVPTVSLAQANSATNARVFAIATETIANNSNGYATVSGLIKNLSLNSFSDGDFLYLSPTVAGGLTATRPSSPNYVVAIGSVASNSNTQGRLIVKLSTNRLLGYGTPNQVSLMNSAGTEEEYVSTSGTGSVLRQTGPNIDGYFDLDEESAPGTPSTDKVRIYAKSDGKIYKKDDAGLETQLATTAEALSNPMTTSGDIIYGGTAGAATRLAANSTASKKFLRSLSSGTPTWEEVDTVKGAAPGSTTVTASPAAGYVGETVEISVGVATNFPASATFGDFASSSISLTAGVWAISFQLINLASGATVTAIQAGVSTATGNSTTGLTTGYNYLQALPATSSVGSSITISNYRVNVTSTTTYYGKVSASYSAGTPQYCGRLTAIRIA